MESFGIIALLIIGFFAFRFFMHARSLANTANSVVSTGNKINMGIQIVRGKMADHLTLGSNIEQKQFYIGYLDALAEEQARVDEQPLTMFRALVAQEAAKVIVATDQNDSIALYEDCKNSATGIEGRRLGSIDGRKLADRFSAQPYFIELDRWIAHIPPRNGEVAARLG
jgi:hypothetical protein